MAEPTTEQLARFAVVRIYGPTYSMAALRFAEHALEVSPTMREMWTKRHAEFQAALASSVSPSTGEQDE